MIKIKFIFFLIFFFAISNGFSQSSGNGQRNEIDNLCKTVILHHLNDSFYIRLRPLPGVRLGTEDFIIRNNGKKWIGSYYNKTGNGAIKKIRLKKADVIAIIKNIDFQRLLVFPISDSLIRSNSELLLGTSGYFIIICSRGKVRRIEYPIIIHIDSKKDWREQNIFWHSDYIEIVINQIKGAVAK